MVFDKPERNSTIISLGKPDRQSAASGLGTKSRKGKKTKGTAKEKSGSSNVKKPSAVGGTSSAKSTNKLTPKQRKLWNLQLFFLKLILLVIPVYLIITFGMDMASLQLEVARESQWLLNASGFSADIYGAGIVANTTGKAPFFFTINADCTGWKSMLFFAALLFAVPRRAWRIRLASIAAGIVALWFVNIFRVLAVVTTYASYGLDIAMLVHDYLWQIGMGLAALLFWVAWLRLSGSKKEK